MRLNCSSTQVHSDTAEIDLIEDEFASLRGRCATAPRIPPPSPISALKRASTCFRPLGLAAPMPLSPVQRLQRSGSARKAGPCKALAFSNTNIAPSGRSPNKRHVRSEQGSVCDRHQRRAARPSAAGLFLWRDFSVRSPAAFFVFSCAACSLMLADCRWVVRIVRQRRNVCFAARAVMLLF